eukprot:TRINITY_DN5491_c0_g2_i2.p1 TRINITY_DN5491_c0_g2~~TRINITY_DN5491_c0_g2_i2.p1  ORF type:complete len:106 (+),score=9.30 TRINITY_DN5491_c0_g2_i2:67-384(+)
MCIRDSINAEYMGIIIVLKLMKGLILILALMLVAVLASFSDSRTAKLQEIRSRTRPVERTFEIKESESCPPGCRTRKLCPKIRCAKVGACIPPPCEKQCICANAN